MSETPARFRASPDVAARDIPEGLMLVNLQTGSAFKLNQVGVAIWKRLDGVSNVAAIAGDLGREYKVGLETLLRDVTALLESLQSHGLIDPIDSSAQPLST